MLSAREIEQYRETGYLVVEDILDKALLSQSRQIIAEFVAGAAKVTQHDSVYDLEPTHRPEAPRVRRIKTPHVNHPFFWTVAKLPKLVGILEQLLGPSGVRLHGSKINLKAPHYGSPVEWHQDWAFYPAHQRRHSRGRRHARRHAAGERPADGDAGDPHGTDLRSSRRTAISPAPWTQPRPIWISRKRWR